jgi:hypothetical protein
MARTILDSYFHGRRTSRHFPEGRENWTLVIRNTDEGTPAKERYWVLTECASPTDARQPCYNTRFSRLKDARAFLEKWKVIQRIPSEYPVKRLAGTDTAISRATCGTCGLSPQFAGRGLAPWTTKRSGTKCSTRTMWTSLRRAIPRIAGTAVKIRALLVRFNRLHRLV